MATKSDFGNMLNQKVTPKQKGPPIKKEKKAASPWMKMGKKNC
jgi:hypothetical protein